jgi:transcription initiation factor TFIIIB Brf1 subunit/transcription initiation factor TFIIB
MSESSHHSSEATAGSDSHDDRILRQTAVELELPAPTIQTAEQLFTEYHDTVTVLGRGWEVAEAAALYAAIRIHEEPVSRYDLLAAIGDGVIVGDAEIKAEIKRLKNVTGVPIPPETVDMVLESIFDELEVEDRTETIARDMAEQARETGYLSGNSRRCVAAGIAYIVCNAVPWERKRTQEIVADAADATELSIRKHYRAMIERGITPDEYGMEKHTQ